MASLLINPPRAKLGRHRVNEGLLSWWPLYEGARDIRDRTNGSFVGLPRRTQGQYGRCLYFDGSTEVNASDARFPMGQAARSMACWFKVDSSGSGFRNILEYGTRTFNQWWAFILDGSHILIVTLFGYDVSSTVAVNDNRWHFTAATFDGNTITFYLDNRTPITNVAGGSVATVANLFRIGSTFPGWVNNARIWNRVLSPSEVRALRDAPFLGMSVSNPSIEAMLSAQIARRSMEHPRIGSRSQ